MKARALVLLAAGVAALPAMAEDFSFEAFTDVWVGTISSTSFGGYSDPITLTVYPDGYYTDTSGHLMPSIYPDTQQCEYDAGTNRVHFWYLQTVYSGQYFYQHFYYEVVAYTGDSLEMHWNFWDDPEPHPEVGTISVTRQGSVGLDGGTWAAVKAAFGS